MGRNGYFSLGWKFVEKEKYNGGYWKFRSLQENGAAKRSE
jgi:hypothetical protein